MQQDTRRYLIAGLLFILAAGLTQGARALRGGETIYKPDFSLVPMTIGEYKGEKLPDDKSMFNYLGAQAMEERLYTGPERRVSLTLIYGTDWRSIHAPTGCFPAAGWSIVHNRVVEVAAPKDCPHPGPLEVRVLEATKEKERQLAVYCYARPNGTTADWTAHGWKVATGPRGAGGMIVTLRTNMEARDDAAVAQKALTDLLATIYPRAVAFWYTGAKTG
jgi:hypothetical protein